MTRATDLFELPLGTLVEDGDAQAWVFIGVSENVVGKVLNFARVVPRKLWRGENPIVTYAVALPDTALKKFPSLQAWQRCADGGCRHGSGARKGDPVAALPPKTSLRADCQGS